jgi:hypothetical protein
MNNLTIFTAIITINFVYVDMLYVSTDMFTRFREMNG